MKTIPIGIAAGMIKTALEIPYGLLELVHCVTFGSYTKNRKDGNPEPNYWFNGKDTSVNAIGLRNECLTSFLSNELSTLVRLFASTRAKLRVSLAPVASGQLPSMLQEIQSNPWVGCIDEVEINAACPNHQKEGALQEILAYDTQAVERLLVETTGFTLPMALKIAPDTEFKTLERIVALCQEFGIASIVSGNTRRVSSTIDGQKRLSVEFGGLGGAPLLESGLVQVRLIEQFARRSNYNVNVVGCGGIMHAEAVTRYAQNGASSVQVATLFKQFGVRGLQDLLIALPD